MNREQPCQFIRKVFYYKNHYLSFYNKLTPDVKKKFNWTIQLVATQERIPEKHFKHLSGSDGLYELRIEYASDIYRVFCFFDKEKLIILLNGFQKKTQKTPKNEIRRAEQLKKDYYYEQKKENLKAEQRKK